MGFIIQWRVLHKRYEGQLEVCSVKVHQNEERAYEEFEGKLNVDCEFVGRAKVSDLEGGDDHIKWFPPNVEVM